MNRLAQERSPYLRQHASNPVDWYPWGEEAFARARDEGRPVFLSVGYAACHWCHVMERESFEDPETARTLGEAFVCVKVDREERPDVDALYMQAVHVMAGRGGWPMTLLLTPQGDPFYAATYLRPDALRALSVRTEEAWRSDRASLEEQARRIADHVRRLASDLPSGEGTTGESEILAFLEEALARDFDAEHGGYGGSPKFPPHTELLHLLDVVEAAGCAGAAAASRQLRSTLDAMADGGIHDQVGGGFHRYSTDERWFLPHFEKMLYDNALLAQAYARAARTLGEARYAAVARGILAWARRSMARPGGGYASSLDADTEGVEGATYAFTADEVRAALGEDDAPLALEAFGGREEGNYLEEATGRPTGRNVLFLPVPLVRLAAQRGEDPASLARRLASIRKRLLEARDRRSQPAIDDKVIAAWNGLLLSAFAVAGGALEDADLVEAGRGLARFLLERSRREDGLLLRFPSGSGPEIPGFLEDHVHVATGLLDLAEATGEAVFADQARALADVVIERFEDRQAGGFWSTAEGLHEDLFARAKKGFDDPIPSENGTAILLLARLAWPRAREREGGEGEARYAAAARRALRAWRGLLAEPRAARGVVQLHRAFRAVLLLEEGGPGAPPGPDARVLSPPVHAALYLERHAVRPGGATRLAVRVALEAGWHVRPGAPPGAPGTDGLVSTRLEAAPGASVTLEGAAYPPPEGDGLAGVFWIRARLGVPEGAPLGPRRAALRLRLQPCDAARCLEPRELGLDVTLRIAEAEGSRNHPAVFAAANEGDMLRP